MIGNARRANPLSLLPLVASSSPERGSFLHLQVSTNKAPPERTDFPRPGENVTAGDKRGNLASRSDD